MSICNAVFVAIGPDEFLLREFLQNYKNAAIEKYGEFSVEKFSLQDNSPAQIRNEIFSPAFFGGKRVIFIEGFPPSATPKLNEVKKKAFESLIKELPELPEDVVVIFSEAKPDKRTKIFKDLKKIATKYFEHAEFDPKKEPYKYSEWIIERGKKYGTIFEKKGADFLRSFVGNNLSHLDSEIQKLALYSPMKEVSSKDIEDLCIPSEEIADFSFSNAVGNGNTSKILQEFKTLSDKYDAGMVFNRDVLSVLRTLLKVRFSIDSPEEKSGIHPYVLRNMKTTANNIPKKKLLKAHSALTQIDQMTKDGRLSLSQDSQGFLLAVEKILHDLFSW